MPGSGKGIERLAAGVVALLRLVMKMQPSIM
jgi:hypothetical protein